jgi:2'-5' RNA ligase
MTRPVANLRLFVALYPPVELARALIDHAERADLPSRRMVREDQVHLTLQFIGDTPSREMDSVIESVQRSASGIGGFALQVEGLIALPDRGAARLVAARTSAPPQLLEVHRRLAHRLARNVRERAGDRFLPHLTLARFTSPAEARPETAPLDLGHFDVHEIVLMRSTLHPEGAEHHAVERVSLG